MSWLSVITPTDVGVARDLWTSFYMLNTTFCFVLYDAVTKSTKTYNRRIRGNTNFYYNWVSTSATRTS